MTDADDNIRLAFEIARDVARDPDAHPDHFVILPMDARVLSSVLSPERVRLLQALRAKGSFESVTALAEAVDRHPSRVSRDISELSEAGLVRTERRGRAVHVTAPDVPILIE